MVSIPKINDTPIEKPAKQSLNSKWRPLRIWLPLLLLAGMVFLRFLPSLLQDGPPMIWLSIAFGPALCGILILIWWLTLSGATWWERILGLFGIIAGLTLTIFNLDPSMRGPAVPVMTLPMGMAGFAIGAILFSRSHSIHRILFPLYLAFLGFGFSTLLRTEGMWGNFNLGLDWRWAQSRENDFLKQTAHKSNTGRKTVEASFLANPEWPDFRGPNRDARQHGTQVATDWSKSPPKLLWKIPGGPSWSSFAVAGKVLFTQEQRGPMETVVCLDADTGGEIWKQELQSRFNDPLGGPGPRATPTLADGALYVTFATGILARLDAATGKIIWKEDLNEVANRKPQPFGYSPSPLVVQSLVIVHVGGPGDKGTLAFNKDTGKLVWSAPAGEHSYSSAQLSKILGQPAVLMLTNTGLNILDPTTGAERLNYEWKYPGYRCCQPQVLGDDSVLLPTGLGAGTRRLQLSKAGDKVEAKELWTTRQLRPDFNDLVVYKGHAYGFDDILFSSINLETGKRTWKGPDYGKGQVLLLEDCGILLVVSEQGELVLVKADPTAFTELAKIQALEGKTWNHPVVIGDRLYLRNSQEIACYQLPLAPTTAAR